MVPNLPPFTPQGSPKSHRRIISTPLPSQNPSLIYIEFSRGNKKVEEIRHYDAYLARERIVDSRNSGLAHPIFSHLSHARVEKVVRSPSSPGLRFGIITTIPNLFYIAWPTSCSG